MVACTADGVLYFVDISSPTEGKITFLKLPDLSHPRKNMQNLRSYHQKMAQRVIYKYYFQRALAR